MERKCIAIVQISGLFLLSLLYSCYPDPSVETLLSYSLRFENKDGERFDPGQKVSVVVDAKNDFISNDPLRVEFSIVKGGGALSPASVITDTAGVARTEWTIGNESPGNILEAKLFSSEGEFIASAEMKAISFVSNKWIEITGDPERSIAGMVADTVNKFTIMLSQGALYRQGDRFYKWEKLETGISGTVRTINMDRHGFIWVSTWNGDIYKSIDHGLTWTMCTKPYPGVPYFIYMCVSNDDFLWVGRPDNTVKFSTDGGTSWQTGPSDFPPFISGNVFRMKNGAIVVHGTNKTDKLRLHISYDDGKTWIIRETPSYSTNMFVTENDEIIVGTQENGFSFYRSTDMGLTYTRVYSVSVAWRTTMERNIFNKWKSFYYIIVPGFGILKSYDLLNYEQYSPDSSFRDLFIDHNGVLIAAHKDYNRIYYLKEPL